MADPLALARQRYADARDAEIEAEVDWKQAKRRWAEAAGIALERARRATDTALVAAVIAYLGCDSSSCHYGITADKVLAALTAQESETTTPQQEGRTDGN